MAYTATLDGTRYVLTVKNDNKLKTERSLERNTEVICLRQNDFGFYMPCLAYVVRSNSRTDRVTVDLYQDRSERVNVTRKAILWK